MVTGLNISEIRQHIGNAGTIVRVVIADHKGSTPRETGTSMLVTANEQFGTIGGGALEFEAVANARKLVERDGEWLREFVKVPLGPSLGQCCGGSVSLLLERFSAKELAYLNTLSGQFARPVTSGEPNEVPLLVQKRLRENRSGSTDLYISLQSGWLVEPLENAKQPLWIYGAGHVGRALVTTLEGLPFDITWIDSARDRFPVDIPSYADMFVAANPADAVRHAPENAQHIVLTYSHAIDQEICRRVLSQPFGGLGLIGSDTKRTRFLKRLTEAGVDPSRLECPIGDRSLGKEPMAIAVGVVTALLKKRSAETQLLREVSA